jgi:hypothetical protein
MNWYLLLILIAVAVVLVILNNRNSRSLAPALYKEFASARYVPLGIIFASGVLLVLVVKVTDQYPVGKILFPVFLVMMFVGFRLAKEAGLRKTHLPREFVQKERLYDLAISGLVVVILTSSRYVN